MAETREQKKARLEREGWREYKSGRFVRPNKPTEHASTDSIMDTHYAGGDAIDSQIGQMMGNTPGGNK